VSPAGDLRAAAVLARMTVLGASRRPWRLGLLAAGMALAGAASFGALLFHGSIGRSLDSGIARLGADAAILPAGVAANLTPVLLSVEPGPAVLPAGALGKLASVPAVARCAPQRALKIADAGGHLPLDLVVFDPEADITVLPWVTQRLARPLARGDVIAGGRRPEAVGERFSIQGVPLVVHGKLGLAGAGPFERSLFIGPQTARSLAEAGALTADGVPFPVNPLEEPTGALVRLGENRGPEELRFAAASIPELTVHTGPGSQAGVRHAVASLAESFMATLVVALTAPAVLVGVAYTGMLAERRRELGAMLAMGVARRLIVLAVVVEAALAALAGAIAGVVVAFGFISIFLRTVGFNLQRRDISLELPAWPDCLLYAAASMALVSATAIAGAGAAAWLAASSQPWHLLRGDGE